MAERAGLPESWSAHTPSPRRQPPVMVAPCDGSSQQCHSEECFTESVSADKVIILGIFLGRELLAFCRFFLGEAVS